MSGEDLRTNDFFKQYRTSWSNLKKRAGKTYKKITTDIISKSDTCASTRFHTYEHCNLSKNNNPHLFIQSHALLCSKLRHSGTCDTSSYRDTCFFSSSHMQQPRWGLFGLVFLAAGTYMYVYMQSKTSAHACMTLMPIQEHIPCDLRNWWWSKVTCAV